MTGKHRRSASSDDKKPCRWCKGKGKFHAGATYVRCGRCLGSGTR